MSKIEVIIPPHSRAPHLSDGPVESNATCRPENNVFGIPTNKWTPLQRTTLCILLAFFDNGPNEMTAIFNKIFENELASHGLSEGISRSAFEYQWRNMRKGLNGHDIWCSVFYERKTPQVRRDFGDLKDCIEEAARKLKIRLILSVETRHSLKRKALDDVGSSDSETGIVTPTFRAGGDDHLFTPVRARVYAQLPTPNSRQMHKPEDGLARRPKYSIVRETGDGLLSETRPIPRLLYRFFDSGSQGINQASGFMAGLFVHHPLVPSHLIEEAVFEAASIGHLTPEIKPSPFVSFFDSLRPALYRALQSSLDPYISIIDTADLMEAHKRRHGVENGCIFSAEDIIFRYKMKLRRNYYGPSEWLVWGSVPSVAVVTTFSMRQLRDYVYTNAHVEEVVQIRTFDTARCYQEVFRKLEYPAHLSAHQIGNTIRALLLAMRMPEHHLLEAARTVRAKWRLNEADPVAFYRGVLGKRAMIAHEGRVLQEDQPEYHIMEELTERFSTWSNAGSDLARQAEQYTWPSAGIDGEKVQSLRTLKPQRSVAGDIANADLTAFANDMLRYLAEGTPSPAAWAGCCIPPPVRTLLSPSVRSPTPAAIRKSRRKRNFIDLTTKDHDYYTSTSKGYASRLDVDDHDTEDSGFIIVHRNNEEKDSFRRMQGDEDEDLVYLTAPED